LPIALSLSRGKRKWQNPVRKSGTAKFIADNLSKADGVVSDPAAGPRTNELPLAETVNNFVTPGR
jgi:hypothetical protein